MSQKVRLTGAVVVSTPQDLALIDARRGVALYQTVHVPVLGLVENMSFYECPECGHQAHIFGHGGVKAEAEELGVRLLGQVRNSQLGNAVVMHYRLKRSYGHTVCQRARRG